MTLASASMPAPAGLMPVADDAAAGRAAARAGGGAAGGAGDAVGLRERQGPRHPALGGSLEAELALLLGQPWDDELEPFRHAAAGAPVRWLHATG